MNLQPDPAPLVLEWRAGPRCMPIGLAHDDPVFVEDLHAARRQLLAAVDSGDYALRKETRVHFEYHYDSVPSWEEFTARPKGGPLEVDPGALASALAGLGAGEGAVVAKVVATATVCVR